MNQEQLVARREVVFQHPVTGEIGRYYQEQIGILTEFGIVIHVTDQSRTLLPWHLIVQVNFHKDDYRLLTSKGL